MVRERLVRIGLVMLVAVVLFPAFAAAQTGTIAGSVKDVSGAIIPGVTVEAASPALIEKVRTAVTDSAGAYKIVDLRAGMYTVTFTLTGFNTVKREGVELTAGVTVNVSPELRVGALQETITVSGESPLVDVQNATQHKAVSRDAMDDLPTGRRFVNFVVLIPGTTTGSPDVGGNTVSTSNNTVGIHGSSAGDMPLLIDGMRYSNLYGAGTGGATPYVVNDAMVEEIAIDTAGLSAEAEVSAVRANLIFRQGGNMFKGGAFLNYTNNSLIKNNFDDALLARQVAAPATYDRIMDSNIGYGGPIKKDKIWFYGAFRFNSVNVVPVGAYYAKDPTAIIFTPPTVVNGVIVAANSADLNKRAVNENPQYSEDVRVTMQTSPRSKLSLLSSNQQRCLCAYMLSSTTTWEASSVFKYPLGGVHQATWNWTASNKLLVELGETIKPETFDVMPRDEISPDTAGVLDSGTGISSRNFTSLDTRQESLNFNGKAIVSYVTGSHNLKIGSQWFHATRTGTIRRGGDTTYNLRNGVPQSITQYTTPIVAQESVDLNLGLYVQEQYTLKRLTANLGVRYDHLGMSVPAQHEDAVRYLGARDFPAIDSIVSWNDITPRIGLSWDVFGNGKTALKWSTGKFLEPAAAGFIEPVNPLRATSGTVTTRNWGDANGNLLPDCVLTNLAANGECGASQNPNFGKAIIAQRYDPAVVHGWGARTYNWEIMAGVQHQVRPGLSVEAGYFRRWFGNQRMFQNVAVSPGDFDPYCVTTPLDARLPGGGGQQICGFYDIKPSSGKFGVNDTLITSASNIGDIKNGYHGVDLSANLRLPHGITAQGGLNVGRSEVNFCDVVVGHPEVTAVAPYINALGTSTVALAQYSQGGAFCDIKPPFVPQVKFLAMYPLPWWGLRTSATFQSVRQPPTEASQGIPGILASRSFTSAEIQNGPGGLGRPLAGGVASTTLQIVAPGALYEGRMNQLDFRLSKDVSIGRSRLRPQLDIYNLLNDNTVLSENTAFGTAWRRPTAVLQGRTFKFGVQADF